MKLSAILRSIFVTLVIFPIWTVLMCSVNILHNLVWGNRAINDWMISRWCRVNCWLYGVRVKCFGLENLPSGSCLLLFNHTSFFDIFSIQSVIPGVRFGAKIELFKIPVFGPAMRRIGVLPIARGDLESVMRVYKAAESRAAQGEKFALAPEGGRNTGGGNPLLPFKSGPFIFAMSAHTPILPVVVKGAREVWPKGRLIPQTDAWTSEIELHFLDLIPTTEPGHSFEKSKLTEMKNRLQQEVFVAMADKMDEIDY